jgi:heme exporter protein C
MGIFDLANPDRFERFARPLAWPLGGLSAALIAAGLYFGLFRSPPDYQQGETVRIMYVHVPAAWMALMCYTALAMSAAVGFIWRHPLADVAGRAIAPVGAVFTAVALITGSLWGKPMWGAWWAWDARLTSVLVLFFLYLGYMAVWAAIEDKARAARLAAVVAIAGFVNVPIIKFSVDWWNSLHQPASVLRKGGPTIDGSMLTPLLLMGLGYALLFAALLLASMLNEIMSRRLERLLGPALRPPSTVRAE